MGFFSDYKYALLFYGAILVLLYLNRKKFQVHANLVYLYRTKIGLKLMDKWAKKHNGLVKIFGYCSVGIGFLAMIFVFAVLTVNLFYLFTRPDSVSGVAPVIPGVKIPGSPIVPPLIIGWIALFVIIAVHEFSHGVVARAHNVKVKNSGVLFFGPIMGAFVEPDEKDFQKRDPVVQYSVFAAGSFSNVVLAVFASLIMLLAISPLENSMTNPAGFSIGGLKKDFPAEKSGITPGEIITGINGKSTATYEEFQKEYKYVKPGDEINVKTNKGEYKIKTADDKGNAVIGVTDLKNEMALKNDSPISKLIFSILLTIKRLLEWVYTFSIGIGIINLLPLGPLDGGRMMHTALNQIMADKGRAMSLFARITSLCIVILLLNIFYPGLRYLVNYLL